LGFESIVAKIESLPPLPDSVVKIEQLFAQNGFDVKEMIRIVEKDPLLTAEILARVNAPYYGLRNAIVSLNQAVTLLGAVTIRGIVLQTVATRAFEIDMTPYGIDNARFAKLTGMQNALMFQWYMGVDIERAKWLIPLTFLLEIGKVVIAREIVQSDYAEAFSSEVSARRYPVETIEREFVGMSGAEVNVMLFERWRLPEAFVEPMRYLDGESALPESCRDAVSALRIVRTCINVNEMIDEHSIAAAVALCEQTGLQGERFENAAVRVWQRFKDQN